MGAPQRGLLFSGRLEPLLLIGKEEEHFSSSIQINTKGSSLPCPPPLPLYTAPPPPLLPPFPPLPPPSQGFSLWAPDPAHDWVGASPDGLLSPEGPGRAAGDAQQQQQQQAGGAPGFDAWLAAEGEGVLEIKCPHKASPGRDGHLQLNPYYMHQVGRRAPGIQTRSNVRFSSVPRHRGRA
jgi:hypothetical protein